MMEKQEMKKICHFSTRYPSLYSVPTQIKIILIVAIQERSDITEEESTHVKYRFKSLIL